MSVTQLSIPGLSQEKERIPEVGLNSFVERTLLVTLLLDRSSSMKGNKITQLNWAVRQLLAKLTELQDTTFAGVDLHIQIIPFACNAEPMFKKPLPLDRVTYKDLEANGSTNMVASIDCWRKQLAYLKALLALKTVGILLTDGWPNHDPAKSIERLLATTAGRVSQRAAIAFGADAHRETLQKFLSEGQKIYEVDSPEELAESLEVATMAAIEGSLVMNSDDAKSDVVVTDAPPLNTMPTQVGGGLSDEDKQALIDAGFDPEDFDEE